MTIEEILNSDALAQFGTMMLEQSKQKTERKYTLLNEFTLKGKIVIIGDSLVEQFPLCEFFGDRIYNRGISGDTSAGMLKRLPNTVLPLKPKKVLIWVGTNDLQDQIKPIEIAENVRQAGEVLQEECGSEICLLAVAPVNESSQIAEIRNTVGKRKNRTVRDVNELYKGLCRRSGWKYIDIYSLLEENGELPEVLTEDGLHLNITGYRRLQGLIENCIHN